MAEDETWFGGFYEVAIVLGKTDSADSNARLREALSVLYALAELEISGTAREDLDGCGLLKGTLDHPSLGRLPFGLFVVRERETPGGDDWLYACVPLGGLSDRVEAVGGWPAGDQEGSRSWREPLERTLAELAVAVAHVVPIESAFIGFEIAGIRAHFERNGPRRIGFVIRDDVGQYRYWPTTDWD